MSHRSLGRLADALDVWTSNIGKPILGDFKFDKKDQESKIIRKRCEDALGTINLFLDGLFEDWPEDRHQYINRILEAASVGILNEAIAEAEVNLNKSQKSAVEKVLHEKLLESQISAKKEIAGLLKAISQGNDEGENQQ